MNQIVVSGRLVKDVELHQIANAPADKWVRLATCSVAVFGGKSKEGIEVTYYFDLAFRVYSEKFAALLKKGTNVVARGSLTYKDWEKDGKKGRNYGINADQVEPMLPPKPKADGSAVVYDDLPF